MRYISELIDSKRKIRKKENSVILEYEDRNMFVSNRKARMNLLALGDVGGTVLTGLRLLGSDAVESIGIYDLNEKLLRRYEREINQICFPDCRVLPHVEIIDEAGLFDCDMFVFCASKGVPPVGAGGDVRMAQLEANRQLVSMYSSRAVSCGFRGIFAVVSDPVDPLCKSALSAGLRPEQVQGYGLGVMHGRACYYSDMDERMALYRSEGRAFGPHGQDLVIANSIMDYDDGLSAELTALAVNSNMATREDGFKPYIAPAMSSGAVSLTETLQGNWNYSSHFLGSGESGAFLGCLNRRTAEGIEIEDRSLDDRLFERIESAYRNLEKL